MYFALSIKSYVPAWTLMAKLNKYFVLDPQVSHGYTCIRFSISDQLLKYQSVCFDLEMTLSSSSKGIVFKCIRILEPGLVSRKEHILKTMQDRRKFPHCRVT